MPPRHQNHSCSQHLVERCFNRLLAVTATVQRLTAGVKRQRTLVFCYMNVQSYVGIADADIRAFSCSLTELVDDSIFHLVGNELRVSEFLGEYH